MQKRGVKKITALGRQTSSAQATGWPHPHPRPPSVLGGFLGRYINLYTARVHRWSHKAPHSVEPSDDIATELFDSSNNVGQRTAAILTHKTFGPWMIDNL